MHYHVTTARRCVDGYLAIKTEQFATREAAIAFHEATLNYPETVASMARDDKGRTIASHPTFTMIRR